MSEDLPTTRIETALLDLLADRSFHEIRLAEVAELAGVPLADLRRAYDGPFDVLSGFARRIDVAVLAGDDASMRGEPIKQRLADALMRRFDLLAPHRAGLAGLSRSARRDPALAVHLTRLLVGSQAWILEAAGVSAGGPWGAAKATALAVAVARIAPTFLAEEDAGLPKTMAALDAALDRLGKLAERTGAARRLLRRWVCRRRERPAGDGVETGGSGI
ncbi:MAG: TetR/AcrR family transcriptional regulator [Phyllobacteriaceae bacterium]|nr:TetR/AcrR family transcriptional regulator [Phyllobacteriaceae bacterium]